MKILILFVKMEGVMLLLYNNSPFLKQRPKIQSKDGTVLIHLSVQLKNIYSDT